MDALRLDVAVPGRRHHDAAPPRHRQALFEPPQANGPAADRRPLARRALHREGGGRRLRARRRVRLRARRRARALARSCSAAFLPYVVASQTIPILAIAPIVVVGLGLEAGRSPSAGSRVSVIAAYLTFFPVTINTLRGLSSADPRAVELMRSYAAGSGRSSGSCACPRRCRSSSPRSGSRRPRRRRRDHRRAAVVDPGRPRRRDPQLQPVLLAQARRTSGRRT